MKHIKNINNATALFSIVLILFTACGGGGSPSNNDRDGGNNNNNNYVSLSITTTTVKAYGKCQSKLPIRFSIGSKVS